MRREVVEIDEITKRLREIFIKVQDMPINDFKELINEADTEYEKISKKNNSANT